MCSVAQYYTPILVMIRLCLMVIGSLRSLTTKRVQVGRTLILISGLRGFLVKSSSNLSSPSRRRASGKYVLNHDKIASRPTKRSRSMVGANRVHVKDLSLKWSELAGRGKNEMTGIYFVWERDEHEGVARPNVKVIRIKQEFRLTMLVTACRHFKFNIFMRNIFLLEINSGCLQSASLGPHPASRLAHLTTLINW